MADIQKEMAIRLAWYFDRYGGIPTSDQVVLARIANGFLQDDNSERLRELANEITEYFRSMD